MAQPDLLVGVPAPDSGFDPYRDEVRRDPYPYYHWLLRNDPVHRGAHDMWYVSRYADVRLVMSDARFGRGGFRDFWAEMVGPGPLRDIMRLNIFFQDPPDHTRLRALVQGAFAPRVVNALPARIAEIVDRLLEPAIEHGEMDVVGDFAYRLPLTVVGQLLGIPAEDHARLRAWTLAIAPTVDPRVTPEVIARGHAAMGEYLSYLRELLPRLRRVPGDDLLSALLAACDAGQATEDEVICMAVTLVLAGHETTTNLIANGLLALLRHPEQLDLLREHPDLITNAVEECLRYDSPVQQNTREVQEDNELGGKLLRRGEIVVALQGAANRDPAQFEDPDRFDIRRPDIHPMSFGAGRRFCVGAPLARLESRIALGTLVRRLHDIHLAAPQDRLRYEPGALFRGAVSLPIAFRAAKADHA